MTRQTRGRRIDWRRAPSLTTALIDVDLALTNVVFQQGPSLEGANGRRPRADHAIECVTRLPGEDLDSEAETHLVYLSGYAHSDRLDWDEDFDPRSVCYIATDRRPGHAWRTSIFIESFIFRRVVGALHDQTHRRGQDFDPGEGAARFVGRDRSSDDRRPDHEVGGPEAMASTAAGI